MHSLAGYCVATGNARDVGAWRQLPQVTQRIQLSVIAMAGLMGIGDRHSDNIMIDKDGQWPPRRAPELVRLFALVLCTLDTVMVRTKFDCAGTLSVCTMHLGCGCCNRAPWVWLEQATSST